jgi:hypothetical protein
MESSNPSHNVILLINPVSCGGCFKLYYETNNHCHHIDKLLRGWFPLGSWNIYHERVFEAGVETTNCEELMLVEFKPS